MNKHQWFSERLNQFVNLERLPKVELIAEIFRERQSYLELEKELRKSIKNLSRE